MKSTPVTPQSRLKTSSLSPTLPDSLPPFLSRLRKPFPPIRSVLGETKSLQFCIDNEAFQDCWCNRLLRIVSNCFCDDLAARNYDLFARNCFCDDFA
ncbi:hypothetical protein NC653_029344 [Populus alba x Populus x berolinensis]|uniref:Uncharacterized protein n=1 Tax=Populus alba x Populus x berolinensis TaxID=444605 RepID=A0AAD6Q4B5_9ROSI|nr:hypothetical protein NC653_029344 [Populus alba x Populus x berolinensis]